jgi:hypothetical protein
MTTAGIPPGRRVLLVLLAWVAFLAVDFFVHGGALARLYLRAGPAILPPMKAFARIPFGYGGFLLYVLILYWVMGRSGIAGWRRGARFGFVLGLVWSIASTAAQYSILTVPVPLLVGWGLGQTLEFTAACAALGAGFDGAPTRRIALAVGALLALLVIVTVILQSTGVSPPMIGGG